MLYTIQKVIACWCKWLTSIILATWEAEIGRITDGEASWDKEFKTPISKITRAEWTRGVAQVTECLRSREFKLQSHPKKSYLN
jgi:hypothetical protein